MRTIRVYDCLGYRFLAAIFFPLRALIPPPPSYKPNNFFSKLARHGRRIESPSSPGDLKSVIPIACLLTTPLIPTIACVPISRTLCRSP